MGQPQTQYGNQTCQGSAVILPTMGLGEEKGWGSNPCASSGCPMLHKGRLLW